jgi:hypothetical protein
LAKSDCLSMLGFLHILKKCNVPHPDVPMAAFDRIFVEVNWTTDPSVRHSRSLQGARSCLRTAVFSSLTYSFPWPPQPDHSGKDMDLGEFLEALIRVAVVRYSVLEEKTDMLTALRMLLEEKILPMAADAHADPFLAVWHDKKFMAMLSHKGNVLIKAFKTMSNVDPDMKFYTMSLKEWTSFIQKINIAAQGFTHRDIKNTFWRAQGSFAPEFGTMVALKEREEFLEKLHATEEMEVRV